MYLMTCTRPDLAYPLSLLARYVAPGRHRKVHWDAAKKVLRYLCSTSGMRHVLGGQGSVVLTGHSDASWADDQATQRSSQGYTFNLGSGSVSWRSTRSSSVLSSSREAEIYVGAMDAQELRWLTYLLTDLGERPRSPPVLYVDNNVVLALCREKRQEHGTKHIVLRYFLARELQQRGQLRLSYVASRANTANVFTKTLGFGDLQHFCTAIGLLPILPHLSECLVFESHCVHFGHSSAGGCQRSSGDPRLIIGKSYRLVVLGSYVRTGPLLNKPFYPNGLSGWDSNTGLRDDAHPQDRVPPLAVPAALPFACLSLPCSTPSLPHSLPPSIPPPSLSLPSSLPPSLPTSLPSSLPPPPLPFTRNASQTAPM
ncbi:unnamed protein product [Closterium sp. NIES-53]